MNLSSYYATCSCYDHLSTKLPCRHIFYARKHRGIGLFTIEMVPNKHRLNPTIVQAPSTCQSLVTEINNLNSVESLITSDNMNQKTKYNIAFRLAQELCNSLKYLKQDDYKQCLSVLLQMKNHVSNKQYQLDIVVLDKDSDETLRNQEPDINVFRAESLHNVEHSAINSPEPTTSSKVLANSSSSSQASISSPEEPFSSSQEAISSSQASVTSSVSSIEDLQLDSIAIINAPKIGRKSKAQQKALYRKDNLSMYSQTTQSRAANAETLPKVNEPKLKTNEQRLYDFFKVILVNNEKALDYLTNDLTINETDIIVVNNNNISKEMYYIYNQFLRIAIKKYLNEDAYTQLLSLLNSYKLSRKCIKCKNNLLNDDKIKICQNCHEIFHVSCLDHKSNLIKSTKQWTCEKC